MAPQVFVFFSSVPGSDVASRLGNRRILAIAFEAAEMPTSQSTFRISS